MKRFRILSLALPAALLLLPSCMKEDVARLPEETPAGKITLSGEISQVYQTRASDAGFADGDAVGIYIVDYDGAAAGTLLDEGNHADNVKHTFDEGTYKWVPAYDIYWTDAKTNIDVYGYYPYANPESVGAYPFTLQKDQSTAAEGGKLGGYEASDFLWGKAENVAPTDKVIRLAFTHRMASARVTLAEGTGFAEGEWAAAEKQVLLLNTTRTASIDLATGAVTATGEAAATGTIPYKHGDDFRAIIVPQTVAAGTALVSITVAGTPYLFKKDAAFSYAPGKQHNFTITVNKRAASGGYEFVLTSESITAWENDNVSHDATAREYVVINVPVAGTLDSCITAAGKDLTLLKNLKVTGEINDQDFFVMREQMTLLSAVNLKEVVIKASPGGWLPNGNYYSESADDVIPEHAFGEKTSLISLVLPDKLTAIGSQAFYKCTSLSGSLIIPEGVEEIGDNAFSDCKSLTGTLSLPSTLKRIGRNAFESCNFVSELTLPESLEKIDNSAFGQCENLYGTLRLPEGLKEIGTWSFYHCSGLTGSLVIPQSITKIPEHCFLSAGFNGTLTLHDGITEIGQGAFSGCHFRGELRLPKELQVINSGAFRSNSFSGRLVLPENIQVIGSEAFAFNPRLTGMLEIPDKVTSIGQNAFYDCSNIEGVTFPKDLENIQSQAFANCFGIGRIICKGTMPAYVMSGAFDGVPKDNFTLEVPESSVSQYQTAVGWSDFKRISAYRNLVCRPAFASAINTAVTRDLILTAESDWSVESQPDWVTLDKTSGNGKTDLKLTFAEMPQGSANREGEIVFKLTAQDYRTRCKVTQYNYEYAEDQMVALQTATKGNGVNLVFLGDGYSAKEISEGLYMQDMNEAVGHFFAVEPYKSYRDYFTVYTGIAVSPESGIGGVNTIIYNRFNTSAKGGVVLGSRYDESDYSKVFEYAAKAPTVSESNINETLVVMIANTGDYAGMTYMYDDGTAIAYCPKSTDDYPYDFRGIVQHEAGGHGFGKLGDEYIHVNAFIDNCYDPSHGHVEEFNLAKANGWYDNLSLSGMMNEVPWSHLIFHEKYSSVVDIFEGGYFHTRGVFRSEQNSCMNNNIPYYSAISREAMVKRIKKIAGETYSFEDFVAHDVLDAGAVSAGTRSSLPQIYYRGAVNHHEPVFMGKRPKLNL